MTNQSPVAGSGVHSGASASIPGGDRPKTVADILTAAADLIEPEGRWVQGASCVNLEGERRVWSVSPDFKCLCALGALTVVQEMVWTDDSAVSPAGKVLRETVGGRVDVWNDEPERTQSEVVAALRAAAEKARTASSVGTSKASEPGPQNASVIGGKP